nr:hypothetical protein [Nitrospirota bacterium]
MENKVLQVRYVRDEDTLLAYLDLLGTKHAYFNFSLDEQIERIAQVIQAVREEIDNRFTENERKLVFFHMYADSVVIAQKTKIESCAAKLVDLMLNVQYQLLINSQYNKMPTLSRTLLGRGKYYGLICSEIQQSIEEASSNFSLIGGSAIIEMDKILRDLPMGTYIDTSLVAEAGIEKERLVNITAESGLKFVRPRDGFDFLRSILPDVQTFEDWVKQLIESSGNHDGFRNKVIPWAEAIQKSQSISRYSKGTIC